MRSSNSRAVLGVLCALGALGLARETVAAQFDVRDVTVDLAAGVILIEGKALGPAPVATLDGQGLAVVSYEPETLITANVPPGISDGTYDLTVTDSFSGSAATLSVFIGAEGPTGKDPKGPAITSTVVSEPSERIFILGSNFGDPGAGDPTPLLQVGDTPTGVESFNPNLIVAYLPLSLEAGSYRLRVEAASGLGGFDMTIGAEGPVGPEGPHGSQGVQGLPGLRDRSDRRVPRETPARMRRTAWRARAPRPERALWRASRSVTRTPPRGSALSETTLPGSRTLPPEPPRFSATRQGAETPPPGMAHSSPTRRGPRAPPPELPRSSATRPGSRTQPPEPPRSAATRVGARTPSSVPTHSRATRPGTRTPPSGPGPSC